jgi:hypothetical protein
MGVSQILYLTLLISEIKVYTHLRGALFGQLDFLPHWNNFLNVNSVALGIVVD